MKRALLLLVTGVALTACASQQGLSASIYQHERRAATLRARGQETAAEAEWSAAEQQRERLARHQTGLVARVGR